MPGRHHRAPAFCSFTAVKLIRKKLSVYCASQHPAKNISAQRDWVTVGAPPGSSVSFHAGATNTAMEMELKSFFLARAAQNLERWQNRAQFEQTATAWTGTVAT